MGHRVVHGKHISEPVLVDEEVMQVIRDAADLAPLHNPANLQGIIAASAVFPGCPQVVMCFWSTAPLIASSISLRSMPFHKTEGGQTL